VRRALAVLLVASLLALPRAARADDPDPWLGPDKALHFTASAVIAGVGYGAGTAIWPDRTRPLLLGAGLGAAAGIGKETLDAMGYGDPSWKDLAWDGIGIVAGLAIAWSLDLLLRGVSSEHPLVGGSF
jgi:putative lipoprotein